MWIAVFYFLYVGANGILTPYLPLYFKSIGFSPKQTSSILSMGPLMIFASPVWGWIADRTGKLTLILKLASAGAAISFAFLPGISAFPAVLGVYCVYAMFSSTISSLADSVAVLEAKRIGTEYSRLRLWGSIGYIVTTYAFGIYLSHGGENHDVIAAGLMFILLYMLEGLALKTEQPATRKAPPSLADAARLLHDPALVTFLIAGTIHWIALWAYYFAFSLHLQKLSIGPEYVGIAGCFAVVAEVLVMWGFRGMQRRLPLMGVIAFSFIVSALRWFLVANVTGALALAAIQALHGFTFGAFFVGSIVYLERTIPEQLRATGRALFAAVVFGIGGIVGSALAGARFESGGGKSAFMTSAVLELFAPLVLLLSAWFSRRAKLATTAPQEEAAQPCE